MFTIISFMIFLKMIEMNYIKLLLSFIENILEKVFFLVIFIKFCY